MQLYRASPSDGVVWVTGASKGIGRALALKFADKGYTVALTARDETELAEIVIPYAGPGRLLAFACDVTDERGMRDTVAAIENQAGPIALAILNAGVHYPTRGDRLSVGGIEQVFQVNFFGAVNGLAPLQRTMKRQGYGQIMLIGSASAYGGWPSAGAYGASKAAINNLAEALKFDFDRMNIRLQVVNPGFIDTALIEGLPRRMPFTLSVDAAAERIQRAIEQGGFETGFPRRLTWLLKLGRALPNPLRHWALNRLTGWSKRPIEPPRGS